MYTYILVVHIVLAVTSFWAIALALGKNTRTWLGRAASLFGAVLGSGIGLMAIAPATLSKGCLSMAVYGAVFFIAYRVIRVRVSHENTQNI